MATGSSNSSGERLSFWERGMVPNSSNIKEGYVVCNVSTTDNLLVDVPNAPGALLGGHAYAGISASAGTTASTDHQITVQRLGVGKCVLKPNTACKAGEPAAYDPVDGGFIVPYTNPSQTIIGRFTQTKLASAGEQMVGVFLTEGAKNKGDGLLGAIASSSSDISNTAVETTFDQKVTIPANTLLPSSILRIFGGVYIPTANAGDTLTLKVKLGATTLLVSAPVDPANAGDYGTFSAQALCRTATTLTAKGLIGVSSTISSSGTAGPQTYNAMIANDVTVTATWSAADMANVVRLEDLIVTLL